MLNKTYSYLLDQLEKAQIRPEIIEHAPVFSCEQADEVTPIPEAGLKTILLQIHKTESFVLCILSGHHKLDYKAVKAAVGKKVSMARVEVIKDKLSCDPGSVPPITPLEEVTILIDDDPELQRQPVWYFNPGVNTKTFGVAREKLLELLLQSGAKQLLIRTP